MIPLVVLLVLALQPLALQPLALQPLALVLQDHQKVHPQYLKEMETHEESN